MHSAIVVAQGIKPELLFRTRLPYESGYDGMGALPVIGIPSGRLNSSPLLCIIITTN